MAVTATRRRIDKALASARRDLESQLRDVRAEMARLAGEEKELTATLASLTPAGSSSSPTAPGGGRARRSTTRRASAGKRARSANGRRGRGRRAASKSTAERVEELRELLADGPKSRNDLAAALKVSPARVQQLLGELGSSVSSQPDSDKRGKLWSLNGAGATRPKRGGRQAKRGSASRSGSRKVSSAK